MKKILAATAFAALLAAPALAQTPGGPGFRWAQDAQSAEPAESAQAHAGHGHSDATTGNSVREVPHSVPEARPGHYLGADPDARVRMQLEIDGQN
jgi:hypothetical protein